MTIEIHEEWAVANGIGDRPSRCSWCRTKIGRTAPGEWTRAFVDHEDELLLCNACATELEMACDDWGDA